MEINQIISKIVLLEVKQDIARKKITQLKKELNLATSDLIEYGVELEKLFDQLQTYRLTSIDYQLDMNNKDVQVFLSKYPKMLTREEE